jgi:hypothetical protein
MPCGVYGTCLSHGETRYHELVGLSEISIFKKPCEDSDRDMLIKELVAGIACGVPQTCAATS